MKERPRVLLLGDDTLHLSPLRRVLSRSARLVSAEDLPHALSLLAKIAFDVVFCDERAALAVLEHAVVSGEGRALSDHAHSS